MAAPVAHFPDIFAPPPGHTGRWTGYRNPEAPHALSNEENYCFDCAGVLCVPEVLSRDRVGALRSALADSATTSPNLLGGAAKELFRGLLLEPTLVNYLNQLIGPGFRLDTLPAVLSSDSPGIFGGGGSGGGLIGGDEPHEPARAYFVQAGRRSSQVVRAVWLLDDVAPGDGGVVVVQASHKMNVPAPPSMRDGSDTLGLTKQLYGRAGDLWLIAGSTMVGMQPWVGAAAALLGFEYCGRAAILSNGDAVPPPRNFPSWAESADPATRAVLWQPGAEGSSPPPIIVASGAGASAGSATSTLLEDADGVVHPGIFELSPESAGISHEEFFKWELNGCASRLSILSVLVFDCLFVLLCAADPSCGGTPLLYVNV